MNRMKERRKSTEEPENILQALRSGADAKIAELDRKEKVLKVFEELGEPPYLEDVFLNDGTGDLRLKESVSLRLFDRDAPLVKCTVYVFEKVMLVVQNDRELVRKRMVWFSDRKFSAETIFGEDERIRSLARKMVKTTPDMEEMENMSVDELEEAIKKKEEEVMIGNRLANKTVMFIEIEKVFPTLFKNKNKDDELAIHFNYISRAMIPNPLPGVDPDSRSVVSGGETPEWDRISVATTGKVDATRVDQARIWLTNARKATLIFGRLNQAISDISNGMTPDQRRRSISLKGSLSKNKYSTFRARSFPMVASSFSNNQQLESEQKELMRRSLRRMSGRKSKAEATKEFDSKIMTRRSQKGRKTTLKKHSLRVEDEEDNDDGEESEVEVTAKFFVSFESPGSKGFKIMQNNQKGLFVRKVSPSGLAELAGVVLGDRLLYIDDTPADALTRDEAVKLLKKEGTQIVVFGRDKANEEKRKRNEEEEVAEEEMAGGQVLPMTDNEEDVALRDEVEKKSSLTAYDVRRRLTAGGSPTAHTKHNRYSEFTLYRDESRPRKFALRMKAHREMRYRNPTYSKFFETKQKYADVYAFGPRKVHALFQTMKNYVKDKNEKAIVHVLEELFNTEKSYLDSLGQMVFIKKNLMRAKVKVQCRHLRDGQPWCRHMRVRRYCKKIAKVKQMFTEDKANEIFGNLYSITSVSDRIYSDLLLKLYEMYKIVKKNAWVEVTDVISAYLAVFGTLSHFWRMYSSYGHGYKERVDRLFNLMKGSPIFREELSSLEKSCGGSLRDSMILPMQRIGKYQLFFGRLVSEYQKFFERCQANGDLRPDQQLQFQQTLENLKMVTKTVKVVSFDVNREMKELNTYYAMLTVNQEIGGPGKVENIMVGLRHFVAKASGITLQNKTFPNQNCVDGNLYLMSDLIVVAEGRKPAKASLFRLSPNRRSRSGSKKKLTFGDKKPSKRGKRLTPKRPSKRGKSKIAIYANRGSPHALVIDSDDEETEENKERYNAEWWPVAKIWIDGLQYEKAKLVNRSEDGVDFFGWEVQHSTKDLPSSGKDSTVVEQDMVFWFSDIEVRDNFIEEVVKNIKENFDNRRRDIENMKNNQHINGELDDELERQARKKKEEAEKAEKAKKKAEKAKRDKLNRI